MRSIAFVFTGPPNAAMGSLVQVVDDEGAEVTVGWWQHDGTYWRYICPVRMVPELVVPNAEPLGEQAGKPPYPFGVPPPVEPNLFRADGKSVAVESPAQRQRRELKERIKAAPKKEATVPATEIPANWEKCPSCGESFDPQKDELMDCAQCSEPKCTAKCLPNPVEPCADCQALIPEKGEGYSAPPAGALFDNKQVHDPAAAAAAGGSVDDDGGKDE